MARTCVALVLSVLLCVEARSATNIGVVLDNARAGSAIIGRAGGTLTATAADGTLFTLTIPQNTLGNDETITMTPVAQTTNLPFSGGMVAAVQLEPRGLRLFRLATLTIATPTPIPIGAETPLAWHADGSDMYLHPLLVDPRSITFKLMHFSGVGVANGTSAEREVLLNRVPCDQEAALQQHLMRVLQAGRERAKQDLPPDPHFFEDILEPIVDYYDFSLKPMMAVALQSKDDDLLFNAAFRAWDAVNSFGWWLGEQDPFYLSAKLELAAFIEQALQEVSDNEFNRCIKDHKIEEMLALLETEQFAQGMGASVDLRTNQKVEQCGSLELVFESTMIQAYSVGAESIRETLHANATIPIHVKVAGNNEPDTPIATGPLIYMYNLSVVADIPCTISGLQSTNGTFVIKKIELNLNPKRPEDVCKSKRRAAPHAVVTPNDEPAKPPFELVSMIIDPGHPSETATATCSDGTVPLPVGDRFNVFFGIFHFTEEDPPGNESNFKIEKWVPGDGDPELLVQKSYNQDAGAMGVTFTETATLKLYHRPTP